MKRRRLHAAVVLLALLVAGAGALTLRQGMLPWPIRLLAAIDLASPPALLLDWRLAALKHAPPMCREVLRPPAIEAAPVPDMPVQKGCGVTNAVRLTTVAGARLAADKVTCETAAALALWLVHEAQPLALSLLGQRIAAVHSLGTYECRNVVGNPLLRQFRSEHARANAIDVSGFTLADGRRISVKTHWTTAGSEGAFLKAVHQRACRYFRVAIGPAYNAAHHDHLHLDRGWGHACK